MDTKSKAYRAAVGGIIAAAYVVLTLITSSIGLASGPVQVRLSEALCILPVFSSAAIPGLFVGCLLANLMTGCMALDVILGGMATLIGAVGTYLLRKNRYLACVPPILANMAIIPPILMYVYHISHAYLYLVMTIGIGEAISAGVLGQILYSVLNKRRGLF